MIKDFGYEKRAKIHKMPKVVKKSFLISLFAASIFGFIYVSINAYRNYQTNDNKEIEIISAQSDAIKTFGEPLPPADNAKFRIYEDILGNSDKKENIKISEVVQRPVMIESLEPSEGVSKNEEVDFEMAKQENATQATQSQIISNQPPQLPGIPLPEPGPQVNQQRYVREYKSAILNERMEKPAQLIKPSEVRVQILAINSKEGVDDFWKKTSKSHGNLFSGLKPVVEEINLGKRGLFYRLQLSKFRDQFEAEKFCEKYIIRTNKSAGDCIVVE